MTEITICQKDFNSGPLEPYSNVYIEWGKDAHWEVNSRKRGIEVVIYTTSLSSVHIKQPMNQSLDGGS